MIDLSHITYIHVDGRSGIDLSLPTKYAEYAAKHIKFGKYIILTPDNKNYNHDFIEYKYIDSWPHNRNGFHAYQKFCVTELVKFIKTDFCLLYQLDGAIINPSLWKDIFCVYDYIGAPWPKGFHHLAKNRCRVGNGGFSLRSAKFLQVSSDLKDIGNRHEDVFLTRVKEKYMINNNIKIAECNVARKFALEYPLDTHHCTKNVFGVHGINYMNILLDRVNQ